MPTDIGPLAATATFSAFTSPTEQKTKKNKQKIQNKEGQIHLN